MRIVRATLRDLQHIRRINKDGIDRQGIGCWSEENWVEAQISKGKFYVAREGNEVYGAACFSAYATYGRIETLSIDRRSRGQGIGTSLIGYCEALTAVEEKSTLCVGTNEAYGAINYYERQGFSVLRVRGRRPQRDFFMHKRVMHFREC